MDIALFGIGLLAAAGYLAALVALVRLYELKKRDECTHNWQMFRICKECGKKQHEV